jgi:hypothetical protein
MGVTLGRDAGVAGADYNGRMDKVYVETSFFFDILKDSVGSG